jgi:hypothetical protein
VGHPLAGRWCLISAVLFLTSCGGNGVTTPTPVATSITITSSNAYLVLGRTEVFAATIVFSDGTTRPLIEGTWGSDASSVATVDAASGLVTSRSAGEVTIFVDAHGARGSRRITVVPDYQGRWSGHYLLKSCFDSGDWATFFIFCENTGVGSKLPVAIQLTQSGGTITGQTTLYTLVSGPFTTTVLAGGGLAFRAVYQDGTRRITQDWQVNNQVGQLTGSFVQTWTDTTLSGNMVIEGMLLAVMRFGDQDRDP